MLCSDAIISSGVPAATIVPPTSPPPGPISIMYSAFFITSRQVIVLGRIVEYYGQRNGFLQLAKKYNFETKEDLSMAPFLIRDGMDAEKAVKLQQELTNIGIRSQVIRSGSPVTERKRKKFFQRLLSSEV